MRRVRFFAALLAVSLVAVSPSHGYFVIFKEEFYRLYHIHYQQFPEDVIENIYWLEKAAKADFCNPQKALAKIENEAEWEKYRYLFMLHVNLKLIEQHLRLGRVFDKRVAHFYDAPWKAEYLRQLDRAEECYRLGLAYWDEAKGWSEKANDRKFRFLFLPDVQNWEDERERIASGKLDYQKMLNRELSRIQRVREDFQGMNDDGVY
ncbi:MAG: hypothetical protein LBR23_09880 [Spirochaetaceae bacterium]|jgi:hypothetical protein|nr:hypothetical protein [Spirochaetaceae bacterium]